MKESHLGAHHYPVTTFIRVSGAALKGGSLYRVCGGKHFAPPKFV
jgi:hypothetical protein